MGGEALNYQPAELVDGMGFLMGPVLAGMCRYESVTDGSLSLADFADMNDALYVQGENTRRAQEAARPSNP